MIDITKLKVGDCMKAYYKDTASTAYFKVKNTIQVTPKSSHHLGGLFFIGDHIRISKDYLDITYSEAIYHDDKLFNLAEYISIKEFNEVFNAVNVALKSVNDIAGSSAMRKEGGLT